MVKIIPAILTEDWEEFESRFGKVKSMVKRIQLDVGDGKFIDKVTVAPEDLNEIDTIVKFDAHLMVEDPKEWLDRCLQGGFSRVFGHVEKMEDVAEFVAQAELRGFEVGLALDIDTPVGEIEEYIWNIDGLLLLSVNAGESGQEFNDSVLKKIKEVEKLRDDIVVVVDGGLSENEIKECLTARWAEELEEGTDVHPGFVEMEFAVCSHLWNSEDLEEELNNLQTLKTHE